MRHTKKIAILLSAATMALTGCTDYNETKSGYQARLDNLAMQIKSDMKEAGLDIYGYRFVNEVDSWYANGFSDSQKFDWIASNGNKGDFLSFVNGIITNDVTAGEQLSLVVYSISDEDYEYISKFPKTTDWTGGEGPDKCAYTGDIEALQYVIGNETSKLYSVKNLTTDKVLYTLQDNSLNNDGMAF